MELYVNSADPAEAAAALAGDLAVGITVNPSMLAATGTPYRQRLQELCRLADGRPVYAQVVTTEPAAMVAEARALIALYPQLVPKIHFSPAGLQATAALAAAGTAVAVTGLHTVGQALLAARSGAECVAFYTGPLAAENDDGTLELVAAVRAALARSGTDTALFDCVRSPAQALAAAVAGADRCTMAYPVLRALVQGG